MRTGDHLVLALGWTINAIEIGRSRTMALADYGVTRMFSFCVDLMHLGLRKLGLEVERGFDSADEK